MTDYKCYGRRSVKRGYGVYAKLHAILVLLFLVLAMGLAGADDNRSRKRILSLSSEEKTQIIRLQRAAIYAAYSVHGVSRSVRLAEVRR